MQSRILVLPLIPLLVILAGCDLYDFGDLSRFKEDFHQSHPLKPGGRLYLENLNGSVQISGWDQETADIGGTKYATSEAALQALRIDIVASGDSIRVSTRRPSERRGSMGASYVIRVPRRTALERIETSNGSIQVTDIDAPARLVTSNGRVSAERVLGGLEATTSNGGIRALLNKLEERRPVRLTTSNGSVDLTAEYLANNDVTVTTSNGSITLRLPASLAARVEASTSNGSITSDFDVDGQSREGKNRLQGTIAGGGPAMRLATSNGNIRLLRQ